MPLAHTETGADGAPPAMVTIPALSVMVFLHKEVGYQILRLPFIIGLPIGLWVFFYVLGGYSRGTSIEWFFAPDSRLMGAFAVAFAGRAGYLRWQHWEAMKQGLSYPTSSVGVPYLGYGQKGMTYRLGEPALCVFIGILVMELTSSPLGVWLIWSGISLGLWARIVWRAEIRRFFDTHDTILEGEMHSGQADHFTRPRQSKQATSEAVPTGLSDGLAAGADDEIPGESDLDMLRRMRRR